MDFLDCFYFQEVSPFSLVFHQLRHHCTVVRFHKNLFNAIFRFYIKTLSSQSAERILNKILNIFNEPFARWKNIHQSFRICYSWNLRLRAIEITESIWLSSLFCVFSLTNDVSTQKQSWRSQKVFKVKVLSDFGFGNVWPCSALSGGFTKKYNLEGRPHLIEPIEIEQKTMK